MPRRTDQIIHEKFKPRALSVFFPPRWVLYEKPNFKGEKVALDEGDIELTNPFNSPEEQLQNGHEENKEQNSETSDAQTATERTRKFIIGSIRRAVRVRRAHFNLLLLVVGQSSWHAPSFQTRYDSDMISSYEVI